MINQNERSIKKNQDEYVTFKTYVTWKTNPRLADRFDRRSCDQLKATIKVGVPIHHLGYLEQPKFYLWFLTRYFWWSMILNFFPLLHQSSNSWLHISCLSGHDPKNTFIITAQQRLFNLPPKNSKILIVPSIWLSKTIIK